MTKEVRQKDIKRYVEIGSAIDITNYSHADIMELRKKHYFEKCFISYGVYGRNGLIVSDENGQYYAITCRNGNVLMFR